MRPFRAIVLVVATAMLASCSGRDIAEFFENPRPWPNERRILARDWIKPQVRRKENKVYCYRTLGAIECHDSPIPGAEARLIEDYTPGKTLRR